MDWSNVIDGVVVAVTSAAAGSVATHFIEARVRSRTRPNVRVILEAATKAAAKGHPVDAPYALRVVNRGDHDVQIRAVGLAVFGFPGITRKGAFRNFESAMLPCDLRSLHSVALSVTQDVIEGRLTPLSRCLVMSMGGYVVLSTGESIYSKAIIIHNLSRKAQFINVGEQRIRRMLGRKSRPVKDGSR
jgi:hypothetical protein